MNKPIGRWMVFLVCIAFAGQLLVGCSAKSQGVKTDRSDKKQLKIGFTIDTLVLERWTRDRDVFTAVAQELGAQVDVQNANNNLEKQKKQIEDFIAQKMDVIVIVAVDSYGLTEEVDKAKSEGIWVISYDRLIQGTTTDLYITVDNESVGEEMGKTMLEKLPDGGDIVMICGPESDANSQDVAKGFEKTIKDSNLKIVKKTSVSSWKPETGFQAVNGKNISGELYINGKEVKLHTVKEAIEHKIAYVTEDRKGNGLILSNPIRVNTTLANLDGVSSHGVIDRDKEIAVAEEYRQKMRTKCPSVEQNVGNLSGGNQQKVLLAKWMFAGPDVLILDEPTRGIDVGAKYEIYCIINDLVAAGKSVIMISSELPEVLGMSDRIYVMNEGRIVGELDAAEASQEVIMGRILSSSKGE